METTEPILSKPPTTAAERVATEIRGLMGAKKLTIPDLAKKLNVARTTAVRRLDGDGLLTINELEDIAEWLDVPIMRLIAPPAGAGYGQ